MPDQPDEPVVHNASADTAAPQDDLAAFEGEWRITAFDGKSPTAMPEDRGGARIPTLSFSRTGYSGTAGCNSLGGIGTLNGGRYYTQVGPQTVMGCVGGLQDRETVLDAVMRASPTVSIAADGNMTLTGGDHRLTLDRKRPLPQGADAGPAPMLEGARFQIIAVDGTYLTPRSQSDSRPLAFDAAQWRAKPACAVIAGNWMQRGRSLQASKITKTAVRCPAADAAIDDHVRAVFASAPSFSIGPNGEFLLAGGGHWLAGNRDRSASERDTPTLAGNWDIVRIDGNSPANGGGLPVSIPSIEFGATAYGGSTGCNSISGNYIASEARLYTLPRPTTQMGCAALGAQESRIYGLLRGAPRISRAGNDVQLSDDQGAMILRKSDRAVTGYAAASPLPVRYVGAFLSVNGQPVQGRQGDPRSSLTISGDAVRIDIGCGVVSTVLKRRNGQVALISNPGTSDGDNCHGERLNQHQALTRLANGSVSGIVDTNGDLLIAGSGVWLTARKN